jgi:hypothetical protein
VMQQESRSLRFGESSQRSSEVKMCFVRRRLRLWRVECRVAIVEAPSSPTPHCQVVENSSNPSRWVDHLGYLLPVLPGPEKRLLDQVLGFVRIASECVRLSKQGPPMLCEELIERLHELAGLLRPLVASSGIRFYAPV